MWSVHGYEYAVNAIVRPLPDQTSQASRIDESYLDITNSSPGERWQSVHSRFGAPEIPQPRRFSVNQRPRHFGLMMDESSK